MLKHFEIGRVKFYVEHFDGYHNLFFLIQPISLNGLYLDSLKIRELF